MQKFVESLNMQLKGLADSPIKHQVDRYLYLSITDLLVGELFLQGAILAS